jgi:hypothetical protein
MDLIAVIPAKAGIQCYTKIALDFRLRGNDRPWGMDLSALFVVPA